MNLESIEGIETKEEEKRGVVVNTENEMNDTNGTSNGLYHKLDNCELELDG